MLPLLSIAHRERKSRDHELPGEPASVTLEYGALLFTLCRLGKASSLSNGADNTGFMVNIPNTVL